MPEKHLTILYGATGGIGGALFARLMARGMPCCAIFRNPEKFAAMPGHDADACIPLCFDPARDDSPNLVPLSSHPLWAEARVATLVLCAFQIAPIRHVMDLRDDQVGQNQHANLFAQIQVLRAARRCCLASGVSLRVVYIDSGAAYRPIDGWSLYCAGKAYMDMFLQVFALEEDIPLALYEPGVVDTAMQRDIRDADQADFSQVETFRAFAAEHKLRDPDRVAADILRRFLAGWEAEALRVQYRDPV